MAFYFEGNPYVKIVLIWTVFFGLRKKRCENFASDHSRHLLSKFFELISLIYVSLVLV